MLFRTLPALFALFMITGVVAQDAERPIPERDPTEPVGQLRDLLKPPPQPEQPARRPAGETSTATSYKWPSMRLAAVAITTTRQAAILEVSGRWLQVQPEDRLSITASDGSMLDVTVKQINHQAVVLSGPKPMQDLIVR